MILVTGTKRSGTSMWMQVLEAGGFPYLGSPFSGPWEKSIGEANPKGFYESMLRQGVFYATNPHPEDGRWLHPDQVKRHAVKVFIPGLVRTDFAYIGKVVATMRNWRSYGASLTRLQDMEDAWMLQQENGEKKLAQAIAHRSKLPHEVEWWFENYDLIRDVAIRRYPINLASYDQMLRDPGALITKVFEWIGEGDVDKAVAVVEPTLTTQKTPGERPEHIESEQAEVFDTLYAAVDAGEPLSAALLGELNRLQGEMAERWGDLSKERQREDLEGAPYSAAGPG